MHLLCSDAHFKKGIAVTTVMLSFPTLLDQNTIRYMYMVNELSANFLLVWVCIYESCLAGASSLGHDHDILLQSN